MKYHFTKHTKLTKPLWCGFTGYDNLIPGEDAYHEHGSYQHIKDDRFLETFETCPERKIYKLVDFYTLIL